ncbi:MAG: DUF1579 family protein [Prolixibacteraceae bacterium]|nr:DUF1579 family protein [Prolixibacteraceae bacterium]
MSEKQPAQSNDYNELIKKWRRIQQPGEFHQLFKQMEGEWKVKLIFHGGGQKWESECIAKNEILHGGRFLMEQIEGEIYAPDESGKMRPEPYSATRIIGYDNYKKAFCGTFVENQNSYILNYTGRYPLRGKTNRIDFYGLQDEPMLEINDTMMKYTLTIEKENFYKWEVYALALGENSIAFEFIFIR